MTGSVACSARIEVEKAPSYLRAVLWGVLAALMALLLVADVAILGDVTIVDILLFTAVALWAWNKAREHMSAMTNVVCLCEVSRDDEGVTVIFRNAERGCDVSLCSDRVSDVTQEGDIVRVTLCDVERCVWEDANTCLSHEDLDQTTVDLDVTADARARIVELLQA